MVRPLNGLTTGHDRHRSLRGSRLAYACCRNGGHLCNWRSNLRIDPSPDGQWHSGQVEPGSASGLFTRRQSFMQCSRMFLCRRSPTWICLWRVFEHVLARPTICSPSRLFMGDMPRDVCEVVAYRANKVCTSWPMRLMYMIMKRLWSDSPRTVPNAMSRKEMPELDS